GAAGGEAGRCRRKGGPPRTPPPPRPGSRRPPPPSCAAASLMFKVTFTLTPAYHGWRRVSRGLQSPRDHAMYRPRHAEASVLHGVIRQHLDDFLRTAADRADVRR